jgi:hypothetical protein
MKPRLCLFSALLVASAALPLLAAPSFAATQIDSSGTVGKVVLHDTRLHPGASCTYTPSGQFTGITLRRLKLTGPNTNPSRPENGFAIVRATVQRLVAAQWRTVGHGAGKKLRVTDSSQTIFPAVTATWGAERASDVYRAGFEITWRGADGLLLGRETYYVEHHRTPSGTGFVVAADCQGAS